MFELYRKGLMLPSEYYEMRNERKGELKILQAFIELEYELNEKARQEK